MNTMSPAAHAPAMLSTTESVLVSWEDQSRRATSSTSEYLANTILGQGGSFRSYSDNAATIIKYMRLWLDDNKVEIERAEQRKRINEFAAFQEDWDGEGGLPIPEKVVTVANALLESATLIPEAFPTGRGSIQFELEKTTGEYLELEIFEDRIALLRMAGRKVTDKNPSISQKQALLAIEAFQKPCTDRWRGIRLQSAHRFCMEPTSESSFHFRIQE